NTNQWGPMFREAFRDQPSTAPEAASIRTILDALRRIVRDLRLSSREAERDAGISGAQLFVLQALAGGRAASLGALAGQRMLARCPEPMQARLLAAIQRLAAPELAALTRGLGALVREMGLEAS